MDDIEKRGSDSDHLAWLSHFDSLSWQGKKVLDIGCGSGFLCKQAVAGGASVAVGIDMLPPKGLKSIDSWNFLSSDLELSQWKDDAIALSPEGFDLILAFDIIEHVRSPWNLLHTCSDLLSDSGSILITTPNANSWERFMRPKTWSGSQDPQHKTLFNSYSLKFLLERLGYKLEYCKAPVRSIGAFNKLMPQLGGQLFAKANVLC